jgi:microsomal dipeptidase-like Zn-dependent dipeptidase
MQPGGIAELCTLLAERGWTRADLVGLLGANYLRVARQAWAPS